MELKLEIISSRDECLWQFESHLYGIETQKPGAKVYIYSRLNRTSMELKRAFSRSATMMVASFESHLYGIETLYHIRRTPHGRGFESHLYGIETMQSQSLGSSAVEFESHLYGIETSVCSDLEIFATSLNRTSMELKPMQGSKRMKVVFVWIAPLWNWNSVLGHHMEEHSHVWIAPLWNWNWDCRAYLTSLHPCLNRTSMELKLLTIFKLEGEATVWIAPLWNWNWGAANVLRLSLRLNRTSMELKQRRITRIIEIRFRFESHLYGIETRFTFIHYLYFFFVWIAPLWNWNDWLLLLVFCSRCVWIAPLWNWNLEYMPP